MEKIVDFLGTACLVVVAPIILLAAIAYFEKLWEIIKCQSFQQRCMMIPFLINTCMLLGNCPEWIAAFGILGTGAASLCIGSAGKPALTALGVAAHVALFIRVATL